jgi:hypothetical protein
MTVMEQTDIERQVKYLLQNDDLAFTLSIGNLMLAFGATTTNDVTSNNGPKQATSQR